MIKIVDLPEGAVWAWPPYFIIDGDDFLIKPVPTEPYGNDGPIGIFDKEGLAFAIHDKPTLTPLALATSVHLYIRKSFFKDHNGNSFGGDALSDDVLNSYSDCPKGFPKTCVDPRVIMARILEVWAGTSAIFNEGVFHLPSLEEATKWLELNRFIGTNRKSEDEYPGYYIRGNERLLNVPRAIQEIHDINQREEEEEEEQF